MNREVLGAVSLRTQEERLRRKLDLQLEKRAKRFEELKVNSKTDLITHYQNIGGAIPYTIYHDKSDIIFAILDVELPLSPIFAQLGLIRQQLEAREAKKEITQLTNSN